MTVHLAGGGDGGERWVRAQTEEGASKMLRTNGNKRNASAKLAKILQTVKLVSILCQDLVSHLNFPPREDSLKTSYRTGNTYFTHNTAWGAGGE